MISMRREYGRNTKRQTLHYFLCAAVLCVAFSFTQAATVEWYFLGTYPTAAPPPTSFVIAPATPTIADTISFIAPANGDVYLNGNAAADAYGNPLISVDFTNRTIAVTFTAHLDEAIPNIVWPVSGVNGQFGPLDAGTWTFDVVTNSYTFNVSGPPLGIALAGNQIVLSWTDLASIYALQVTTNLSAGSWIDVTNGITTNGTNCLFTTAASSQTAFYRLRQQ
jgi:hypothetical protein